MRITKAKLQDLVDELRMENEKLRIENGELEAGIVNMKEFQSLRLGATKTWTMNEIRKFTRESLKELIKERIDKKSPYFEDQLARFLEQHMFDSNDNVWP